MCVDRDECEERRLEERFDALHDEGRLRGAMTIPRCSNCLYWLHESGRFGFCKVIGADQVQAEEWCESHVWRERVKARRPMRGGVLLSRKPRLVVMFGGER